MRGDSGAATARWDSLSSLCLASYFVIPGVTLTVIDIIRLMGSEDGTRLLRTTSLAFALFMTVTGLLILWRKRFLALLYFIVEGGALVARGSAPVELVGVRGTVYGNMAILAMSATGIFWILEKEFLSRRNRRWSRPAAFLVLTAWIFNAPLLGMNVGQGIGGWLSPPPVARATEAGERLPILSFRGADGKIESLTDPGTVYVVNFWATWCAPCLLELPQLLRLVDGYPPGANIQLIAVNTEGMDRESLEGFLQKEKLENLPVYTDPEGFKDLLGTMTIPLTILIKDGQLLARHVGYRETLTGELQREIGAALPGGGVQEELRSPDRPAR